MKPIEFSDNEVAYVLLALRKLEEALLTVSEDDEGDSINDLLIVQSLRRKIKTAREQPDA
jgi:hypothetical protein